MPKQRIRDIKKGAASLSPESNKNSNSLKHARLNLRLKAFITDTFMLGMPIMYFIIYFVFGGLKQISQDRLMGWIYILIPLILILTIFMLRSKEGQTPGMKAYSLGLRAINGDKTPSTNKPSTAKILARQALSPLSIVIFSWVPMFFRKDRRPLHEILSGTTMVEITDDINNNQ